MSVPTRWTRYIWTCDRCGDVMVVTAPPGMVVEPDSATYLCQKVDLSGAELVRLCGGIRGLEIVAVHPFSWSALPPPPDGWTIPTSRTTEDFFTSAARIEANDAWKLIIAAWERVERHESNGAISGAAYRARWLAALRAELALRGFTDD